MQGVRLRINSSESNLGRLSATRTATSNVMPPRSRHICSWRSARPRPVSDRLVRGICRNARRTPRSVRACAGFQRSVCAVMDRVSGGTHMPLRSYLGAAVSKPASPQQDHGCAPGPSPTGALLPAGGRQVCGPLSSCGTLRMKACDRADRKYHISGSEWCAIAASYRARYRDDDARLPQASPQICLRIWRGLQNQAGPPSYHRCHRGGSV